MGGNHCFLSIMDNNGHTVALNVVVQKGKESNKEASLCGVGGKKGIKSLEEGEKGEPAVIERRHKGFFFKYNRGSHDF